MARQLLLVYVRDLCCPISLPVVPASSLPPWTPETTPAVTNALSSTWAQETPNGTGPRRRQTPCLGRRPRPPSCQRTPPPPGTFRVRAMGAPGKDKVAERVHYQGRVHPGRDLLPPVHHPSHAEGPQLYGRRADVAYGALPELVWNSWTVPAGGLEFGMPPGHGIVYGPNQLLDHVRTAVPVGVRQAIAACRSATAVLLQGAGVAGQAVADVVQAQCMGEMPIDHRHDVAGRAGRANLDPVLSGEVLNDSVRYPACNLDDDGHSMLLRRRGISYVFCKATIRCP